MLAEEQSTSIVNPTLRKLESSPDRTTESTDEVKAIVFLVQGNNNCCIHGVTSLIEHLRSIDGVVFAGLDARNIDQEDFFSGRYS
ncbi:MAG: hypothetical protein R2932_24665 [Caldilineaceae bacterium]